MKTLKLVLSILLFPVLAIAQTADWNIFYSTEKVNKNHFEIVMNITIPQDFHMYSFDQVSGGPIAAKVDFELPDGIEKVGGLVVRAGKVDEFFDDIFGINIRQFSTHTKWVQEFVVTKDIEPCEIKGTYSYQLCKDDGYCLNPFPEEFTVQIPAYTIQKKVDEVPEKKTEQINTTKIDTIIEQTENQDSALVLDTLGTIEETIIQQEEAPQTESRSLWMIFL
ncbi:MAG: hypothetical protein II926_05840, partial [Bacteroidales bacterium]|nr:hypothetical protein [Bacteroidales bacterium]